MKVKRTLAAVAALVMVMALAACGDSDSGKEASATQVADDMLAVLQPQGELLEAAESVLDNYYTIDPAVVTGQKIYISTSFIAEEIAVFEVADGKAEDAKKMVEQRLNDLKASFEGYLPDELASLEENAKVLAKGNLVCLLAGSSEGVEAAEKVFNDALK